MLDSRFISPNYDSFCFSRIPRFIRELLGEDNGSKVFPLSVVGGGSFPQPAKVVLLFLDSFGWSFFSRLRHRLPVVERITERAVVTKLTSQFPSTTAAHVTALHTGLPPGESGIYEWYLYDPTVGRVIAPLLCSLAGEKERGTLLRMGFDPMEIFPQGTHYSQLRANGIESILLQDIAYAESPYTKVVADGIHREGFYNLEGGLHRLVELIKGDNPFRYLCFYYDAIDAASHVYGPFSEKVGAAVEQAFSALEEVFFRAVADTGQPLVVLLTADHGQAAVDPTKTFYINHECPEIVPALLTDKNGAPIVPCGSARDLFLHVTPGREEFVIEILRNKLEGRAQIVRTTDFIDAGFFGTRKPSEVFRSRVGNIIVLPFSGETVWWFEEGKFAQRFRGHHGGLTPEEMEIPLMVWRYGC